MVGINLSAKRAVTSKKMRKERKIYEKSHDIWKKIELNLDQIDVIKNKCQ